MRSTWYSRSERRSWGAWIMRRTLAAGAERSQGTRSLNPTADDLQSPSAAKERRQPGTGVGHGGQEQASRREPAVAIAQRQVGVGQVLQHMPDGDEIECARSVGPSFEHPEMQVEAGN